jgi:hypothetical protein
MSESLRNSFYECSLRSLHPKVGEWSRKGLLRSHSINHTCTPWRGHAHPYEYNADYRILPAWGKAARAVLYMAAGCTSRD